MDSGASEDVVYKSSPLDELNTVKPVTVNLPNGTEITAKHRGTLCVDVGSGCIISCKAYLNESLTLNLLSCTRVNQ